MIHYYVEVNKGIQEKGNQDRALANTVFCNEGVFSGTVERDNAIFAVCDGVGGYSGGDKAATIALQRMSMLARGERPITTQSIEDALAEANSLITKEQMANEAYSKMCTTIAGVAFSHSQTILFHAGDSRVYRYRNGMLAQMTVDHSLAQAAIDNGLVDEEGVREDNSTILRYLGGENVLTPEIQVISMGPLKDDWYILCTDGFWAFVCAQALTRELCAKGAQDIQPTHLVEQALQNGSTDNITVLLVHVV